MVAFLIWIYYITCYIENFAKLLTEQLSWVIDRFVFALNIIEESHANFEDKNIKDMLDEL